MKKVATSLLISGKTKSCGCARLGNKNAVKYGTQYPKRLTQIYRSMKHRCTNPNSDQYELYGGRGITVCNEWLNDPEQFYKWALDSGYDSALTIDRIDVNGNYEPSNCRWATRKEQANNRRNTRELLVDGEKLTISEAARKYNIKRQTLSDRLFKGKWSDKDAVSKKVRGR